MSQTLITVSRKVGKEGYYSNMRVLLIVLQTLNVISTAVAFVVFSTICFGGKFDDYDSLNARVARKLIEWYADPSIIARFDASATMMLFTALSITMALVLIFESFVLNAVVQEKSRPLKVFGYMYAVGALLSAFQQPISMLYSWVLPSLMLFVAHRVENEEWNEMFALPTAYVHQLGGARFTTAASAPTLSKSEQTHYTPPPQLPSYQDNQWNRKQ